MSAPSRARPPRARPADRLRALPPYAWGLIALTVLAAALRFSTLGVQSYWLDEAVTVRLVRAPFGDMLRAIPDGESTPPLYYVIAWLWSKLSGTGEVGLRSLSALVGTATIPVAYLAASRLVTRRAGLVVAALAAVNPLLVWFSQEARAYALLVFLVTASFALFARVIERPTGRALAGWAALSVLALCTHYFAAFVIAPEAALLLWRFRGPREFAAVGAVALAGAGLLPLLIQQAGNDRAAFIRHISIAKRAVQVPKQYLVGFDAPLATAATVASLALATYGLWLLAGRADARERRGASVGALVAVPALALPLILAIAGVDYLITRNVIAGWVPVMTVAAAGLGARRARRAGTAVTVALCAVALATVVAVDADPQYQRGDWRGAAQALGPIPPGGRALAVTPVYGVIPLSLYTPRLTLLPPGPVGVAEIDVVAMADRRAAQATTPPRPYQPVPSPPGFGPPQVTRTETYTLVRYRAANGHAAVTVAILWALSPTRNSTDIAFQAPPGWRPPPL